MFFEMQIKYIKQIVQVKKNSVVEGKTTINCNLFIYLIKIK